MVLMTFATNITIDNIYLRSEGIYYLWYHQLSTVPKIA